jgi:protease-4
MFELLQYRSWCITEEFYNAYASTVLQWISNGHSPDRFVNKKSMEEHALIIEGMLNQELEMPGMKASVMTSSFDQSVGLPVIQADNFRIAVIPMVGALTKYGNACAYGMQDLQAMISRANGSPNIDAMLFKTDSPGGTTDGTQELATTVRDSKKIIGTFIDGMDASAAYWITSQGRGPIIANKLNSNTIGSIGTYGIYQNISEKLSKEGIQMKIIRARQSTKKISANPIEPLTPEAEAEMTDSATAINDVFISYVKSARPSVSADVFDAGVYNNSTAKTANLIDGTGTLNTAINKMVEQLKEERKAQAKSQSNNGTNQNANMKFPKLNALLGAAMALFTGTGTEANDSLTPEQKASLEASEKKLSDQEGTIAQLTASITEKDLKITSLEANVTGLTTQVSTLTSEKATLEEELKKKPTGQATTIIPEEKKENKVAADGEQSATENKYNTSVDDEAKRMKANLQKHSTIK